MTHNRRPSDVPLLLARVRDGDRGARDRLFETVYQELRTMARMHMAREAPAVTLQPTALVHEAFVRLAADAGSGWENRRHFFAIAGAAMRRILIKRARRQASLKRGANRRRVDLDLVDLPIEPDAPELLDLDRALDRLETIDPQMVEVVQLRYFAGLSLTETAEVMQTSTRSVSRLWTAARAWLHAELREGS
jgi:RNA polymerase sigma factor (TIGR02999 family)